jgi:hypothetical protein
LSMSGKAKTHHKAHHAEIDRSSRLDLHQKKRPAAARRAPSLIKF